MSVFTNPKNSLLTVQDLKTVRASGQIIDLSNYDIHSIFMQGEDKESLNRSNLPNIPSSILIRDVEFTYLARGAQAAVYHKDREMVVKLGYTLDQAIELFDNIKLAEENILQFNTTTQMIRQHLLSGRLDNLLIAGGKIDSEGRIWQNWAPPVESVFSPDCIDKYPTHLVKDLLNKFAYCFIKLFKSGACETECSLFTNYSLNEAKGIIIVPDFGNITFDYNKAKASVSGIITEKEIIQFLQGKKMEQNPNWPDWFKKGQVREALKNNPILFRYYISLMSEIVNERTLNENWPEKYR